MRVKPETGERRTLIVDEVEEHERFQEPSKVGWRHEACDRSVFLTACPLGDSRTRTALNKNCLRHKFAFLNVVLKPGALPSALLPTRASHQSSPAPASQAQRVLCPRLRPGNVPKESLLECGQRSGPVAFESQLRSLGVAGHYARP